MMVTSAQQFCYSRKKEIICRLNIADTIKKNIYLQSIAHETICIEARASSVPCKGVRTMYPKLFCSFLLSNTKTSFRDVARGRGGSMTPLNSHEIIRHQTELTMKQSNMLVVVAIFPIGDRQQRHEVAVFLCVDYRFQADLLSFPAVSGSVCKCCCHLIW